MNTCRKRELRKPCLICGKKTNSEYRLCTNHYRAQWAKLKSGKISSLTEVK